jgi:hypothetical protein
VNHTPNGVPYVEPPDTMIDYPALSLELAGVVDPLLAPTVWTDLPLLGGWVPMGGGYAPPAYTLDPNGCLHLRGTISYMTAGPPINVQIAILPACAVGTLLWAQPCIGAAPCRIDLQPNGAFNCVGPIPDGPNAWLSLNGIDYYPDAAAELRPVTA